ncbi:MAG TPA: T9SS type A sorting domain-containing protein, partial [Saprospiraceae bacterium]|nr:T9SS type A sorting domain-containing protein [Saprospiraceae bacterium]
QFDSSSPYTEGYQIFPRYLSDIDIINAVSNPVKVNQGVRVSPNPALGVVLIKSESAFDAVRVTDAAGRTVYYNWFAPVTELNLDTTTWKRGTYHVAVMSGKATRLVQVVKAK